MDQAKREKLLDKVRKCLALANNAGATEHERARALAQAEKLLSSANLSMADAEKGIVERERRTHEITAEHCDWVRPACNGIARLFFCNAYKNNATGHQFYVGKPVNVAATMMMVEYVLANILKESKIQLSVEQGRAIIAGVNYSRQFWKDWQQSFCVGAAAKIKQRCLELVAEREARDDPVRGAGTALVLYNLARQEEDANIAFLTTLGVTIKTGRRVNIKHSQAYRAGVKHGEGISLSQQIARPDGPKLLGRG